MGRLVSVFPGDSPLLMQAKNDPEEFRVSQPKVMECMLDFVVESAHIGFYSGHSKTPYKPYLAFTGFMRRVHGDFGDDIDQVSYSEDEPPRAFLRYDFTRDQHADLVKKGLSDNPAFIDPMNIPQIFIGNTIEVPVHCLCWRIWAKKHRERVPLLFVTVVDSMGLETNFEESAYDFSKSFDYMQSEVENVTDRIYEETERRFSISDEVRAEAERHMEEEARPEHIRSFGSDIEDEAVMPPPEAVLAEELYGPLVAEVDQRMQPQRQVQPAALEEALEGPSPYQQRMGEVADLMFSQSSPEPAVEAQASPMPPAASFQAPLEPLRQSSVADRLPLVSENQVVQDAPVVEASAEPIGEAVAEVPLGPAQDELVARVVGDAQPVAVPEAVVAEPGVEPQAAPVEAPPEPGVIASVEPVPEEVVFTEAPEVAQPIVEPVVAEPRPAEPFDDSMLYDLQADFVDAVNEAAAQPSVTQEETQPEELTFDVVPEMLEAVDDGESDADAEAEVRERELRERREAEARREAEREQAMAERRVGRPTTGQDRNARARAQRRSAAARNKLFQTQEALQLQAEEIVQESGDYLGYEGFLSPELQGLAASVFEETDRVVSASAVAAEVGAVMAAPEVAPKPPEPPKRTRADVIAEAFRSFPGFDAPDLVSKVKAESKMGASRVQEVVRQARRIEDKAKAEERRTLDEDYTNPLEAGIF